MGDLGQFRLEGVRYYQDYRKCGKPNCATCESGRGHGPYWYSRDPSTGQVSYHGSELPDNVRQARKGYEDLFDDIGLTYHDLRHRHSELELKLNALLALINREPLTDLERRALIEMGFGAALVTSSEDEATGSSNQ